MRGLGLGEGKVRNYFPAYRVFIYGIEVTSLCASVRTSWPTNSPEQCTIELVNPDSLMTLTLEDMLLIGQLRESKNQAIKTALAQENIMTGSTIEMLQEMSPAGRAQAISSMLTANAQRRTALDANLSQTNIGFRTVTAIRPVTPELANIKNRVIPKKIENGKFIASAQGADGEALPPELFFKYPFYQGKWIWHFSDPVTVVFRDPSDPRIWYWMHRGTVTDIAEKETEDKLSILTLTCEGVLKTFRSARMFQATGAILTPDIEKYVDGTYETLLKSTPCSNFLQDMTIRNIVELMTFGAQSLIEDLSERVHKGISFAELQERFGVVVEGSKRNDRVTEKDLVHYEDSLRNIGTASLNFKWFKSNQGTDIRILGGADKTDEAQGGLPVSLYEWQRLIDNRVRVTDRGAMLAQQLGDAQGDDAAARGRSITLSNAYEVEVGKAALELGYTIEDTITDIGTNFEKYPIRQRVRMLLPAHLGSRLGKNVVERDMSGSIASQAEFFDRLSLLQKTVDGMEFVIYDTPRGDVIIEMPLYDFEPYHFASSNFDSTANVSETEVYGVEALRDFAGSFQELTRGANTARRQVYSDQDDQHYEWDFAIYPFEQLSIDISSSEQDVKTAFMVTPRIIAAMANDQSNNARKRVTAILPNLLPLYGLRVEQGGILNSITTEDAARVYAHIMLNRTNADTVNLRVPCLSNWAAWPNRPIWVARRNIIATTKTIAHSIAWQSDISTEYGLWHCKFWDGQITNDKGTPRMLYAPFGGVNARPFNYSYILGIRNRDADVASTQNSALAASLLSTHKAKK